MDLGIKNKIALITASSKGLGKATALTLSEEGCKVIINGRNESTLKQVAEEISSITKNEIFYKSANLSKQNEVESLVDFVIKTFGTIHILVTNSGGPKPGNFNDINSNDWYDGFDNTVMSVYTLIKKSLPYMKNQRWGRIVNITSVSVKQPLDRLLLSNSLRMSVIGLAKSLSNEFSQYNILINNVCPGYIATDRLLELVEKQSKEKNISKEEVIESLGKSNSIKRIGRPEELASAIAFLCSEKASYITGVSLPVDGGRYQGY